MNLLKYLKVKAIDRKECFGIKIMNHVEVNNKAQELYKNLQETMYEERLISIEDELQSNKDCNDIRFYQAKQAELNKISAEINDVYSEIKADFELYIALRNIDILKEMSSSGNKGSFTLADGSKIDVSATLLSHTLKHTIPGEVPHLFWLTTKLESLSNRVERSIQTARNFTYSNSVGGK